MVIILGSCLETDCQQEETYSSLLRLLVEDTSKSWFNGEQQLLNYFFKDKLTILDPSWITFVYPICPPVATQKIGHFTHWGIELDKPVNTLVTCLPSPLQTPRKDAEKKQACERPYYMRWVEMYELAEVFLAKNTCRS
jgi:hypothetical protein